MIFKKFYIFLLLFLVLFSVQGCFPVKSVPDVSGFTIVEGNENSKNELERLNKFMFQVYRSSIVFERYLDDRFENEKGFNPKNFRVKVEGVWFNFSVLSEDETSNYLNEIRMGFKAY